MLAAGLGECELSLSLVSDRAIRALNRDWRGIDSATDVLSFSQIEEAGVGAPNPRSLANCAGLALGDVLISIDTALRQAREMRITPASRIRRLLVHGFLHLIGYDHERSTAGARKMFARECALVEKLESRAVPMRRKTAASRKSSRRRKAS